jgi:hypothetical protein
MALKKPWTEEQSHRLKEMALKGMSLNRASAAFGKPVNSCRKQAKLLGVSFPGPRAVRRQMKEAGII